VILSVREWGERSAPCIVCLHGLSHSKAIFDPLADLLVADGYAVISVDLRGHGDSADSPPWSSAAHAEDVIETVNSLGVADVLWVGHSYGGRVAATLANDHTARTRGLALLESPLQIPPERAARAVRIEMIDWGFDSPDGAIAAILSSELAPVAPTPAFHDFVSSNLRIGSDGLYRFWYSRDAVIAGWHEMAEAPPPITRTPTLLLKAERPLAWSDQWSRSYRESLGAALYMVEVPGGHNVFWDAPSETYSAVRDLAGKLRD
jgi:pimeloyl-ACP methyl ester carboxylesterase